MLLENELRSSIQASVEPRTTPKLEVNLRDYQVEAVVALRNNRKGIVAAATGSGKTTMMAASIAEKVAFGRVLVLVHLQDLVRQTAKRIAHETGLKVGEYYTEQKDDPAKSQVLVACWQSMAILLKGKDLPTDFYYSINVDEAHHVSSRDYSRVVRHFSPKFLHGFTATPRGPGEEVLLELFGQVIYKIDLFDLVEKGHLSPFKISVYSTTSSQLQPNLLTTYHQRKNQFILETEKTLRSEGRKPKILHFFKFSRHIDEFSDSVSDPTAVTYTSAIDIETRDGSLKVFQNPQSSIHNLYAIRMLNEGIDVPIINGLVFHEHVGTLRTLVQRLGRGLRIYGNPRSVTYVQQFISPDDLEGLDSLNALVEEFREGLSDRKGREKDFKDLISIAIDSELEAALTARLRGYSSTADVNTECSRCGKTFRCRGDYADCLRTTDQLICEDCDCQNNVLAKCAKCTELIPMDWSSYRRYVTVGKFPLCHMHQKKPKHTLSCIVCNATAEVTDAVFRQNYNADASRFRCKSHTLRGNGKAQVIVHCSYCGKSFPVLMKFHTQIVKRNGQFWCNSHPGTIYRFMEPLVTTCQ